MAFWLHLSQAYCPLFPLFPVVKPKGPFYLGLGVKLHLAPSPGTSNQLESEENGSPVKGSPSQSISRWLRLGCTSQDTPNMQASKRRRFDSRGAAANRIKGTMTTKKEGLQSSHDTKRIEAFAGWELKEREEALRLERERTGVSLFTLGWELITGVTEE
ncbi:hypothetical protein FNV43_RR19396 [Rhamnella rubrinervis]|uniref:Uncharacterized protein n=1 Tax=Rhamnella rubrinervis TaxID=2594499 RepID=A0A8K0DYP6_9ROSA|nr:hypothetical protein FNV43_RR19396 [Rhamnella rubrinervis]